MDQFDEFDLDLSHLMDIEPVKSPQKKSSEKLSQTPITIPRLHPQNDLFQITQKSNYKNHNIFGIELDYDYDGLKNNKIEKLMKDLQQEHQDFEMDNQLRSRIFKGRIKPLELDDEFDMKISNYLDDKENNLEPSKTLSPVRCRKITKKSKTPVLKPLQNNQLQNFTKLAPKPVDNNKRICRPNHRKLQKLKSSLIRKTNDQIFLVDSLTGSLSDATQFGTELNASNCEGFPLPETIHEVVQIPTNEDSKKPVKMAIIKTFNQKFFGDSDGNKNGFYSKTEYLNYLKSIHTTDESGVEVVGQSLETSPEPTNKPSKSVRFAGPQDIEW